MCQIRLYSFRICLLLFFCGLQTVSRGAEHFPEAKNAVIDLRNTDLSRDKVPLNGDWAIYWKRILGPSEAVAPTAIVPFPVYGPKR
jgi:hypothetical protein